jgi:23S rRNA pseudouridine1911/1915/1917 synthase
VVAYLEERGRPAAPAPALPDSALVYVDESLVVVDKPPSLAAQGTRADADAGLDVAVQRLLAAKGRKVARVGLVHRLDLETSGLTVFGLTDAAVASLAAQFRLGTVQKTYQLLVAGAPGWDEREVDQPLEADPARAGRQQVSPRGRRATTGFRVLARGVCDGFGWSSWEARPRTGRTHQIRVHAAHQGFPLLGDRRYGGPAFCVRRDGSRVVFPRVALHAASLVFTHPDGGAARFDCPWPADLAAVEGALRCGPEAAPMAS